MKYATRKLNLALLSAAALSALCAAIAAAFGGAGWK